MADIELDSLVVRDFTEASSEVFKQAVESGEIGENDLSFTPYEEPAKPDLSNTTDNVDFVIESQLPTEDNGHTWYRLYKSGWIEQGGSALGEGLRTVTFPIPMADTIYNVMAVANRSNADAITGVSFTTKTTTSVNFAVSNINSSAYTWNSSNGIRWEVKGMAMSAPQQPNIYPGQD